MIVLERGTVINHIGGSIIGHGPLLKFKYANANDFQVTSRYTGQGLRPEFKGNGPMIDHDPASTIGVSNAIRVALRDMDIQVDPGVSDPILARIGGRVMLILDSIQANRPMSIDAYMTTALSSNLQFGAVVGRDLRNIDYRRVSTVAAYGGNGVPASDLRRIPALITKSFEAMQWEDTGSGYLRPLASKTTILSGGPQIVPTGFAYAAPNTNGFGSGANPSTTLFQLPKHARPTRFRIIRDNVNASSPFVFDLFAVIGGTDHKVASITPSAGIGGQFEVNIQLGSALTNFIVDGTNWDGRMKFVKSGTVNGFVGSFFVDFV